MALYFSSVLHLEMSFLYSGVWLSCLHLAACTLRVRSSFLAPVLFFCSAHPSRPLRHHSSLSVGQNDAENEKWSGFPPTKQTEAGLSIRDDARLVFLKEQAPGRQIGIMPDERGITP